MFNKRSLFISLICSLLLLTGCTKEANRIYTVCKVDAGQVYCYNDTSFYTVSGNNLIEIGSVGLKRYPALQLTPTDGNFEFKYVVPGHYRGTLHSVNCYANKLLEDGYTYDIVYTDCNNLEVYFDNSLNRIRLIYNIQGDVRIYCIDNSDNPIVPIYLDEE